MTFGYGCTPNLANNTIIRNRCTSSSSSASGGGIHAFYGSSCTGENNIIYDNSASTNPNFFGTLNITYSCCEQYIYGSGNITDNPLFVHTPPAGYCFLSQFASGQGSDSPCVDAGDPSSPMIGGSTRTDMIWDTGVVDMGFHWTTLFHDGTGLAELLDDVYTPAAFASAVPTEITLLPPYPNPFNPETKLIFELKTAGEASLVIYDIFGREVVRLVKGWHSAGVFKAIFDGSQLSSGVYFARLTAGGFQQIRKLVLIK